MWKEDSRAAATALGFFSISLSVGKAEREDDKEGSKCHQQTAKTINRHGQLTEHFNHVAVEGYESGGVICGQGGVRSLGCDDEESLAGGREQMQNRRAECRRQIREPGEARR
ncbi:hypothetical protein MPTK1_6g07430 [Marchantia polymorpha subsp. ruderalis]|uniref:Uncharacterized protein n=2 Tax=Marchantia polymorpha TaxID=3197 RepID=A0AAF6BPI5_MARPO|nr:hypothetical protein MARPO_0053s0057 [Marchantia polymorpha]BBN13919.1 hypothetical protein Mp_6g07430 [Marchantia polymorpha subsp. ruderalis]|eukprot:PTQ38121.1 hypothetical protein MARPO_0053s0057 [Marchantia polymorpha]